jgi:hypothetical protein
MHTVTAVIAPVSWPRCEPQQLTCCAWLDSVQSAEGLQAVMNEIVALLAIARRQLETNT